ncbi:hypothetical protein JCM10207_008816 [Rhodosporidiobolus poonsookiae]
MAVATQSAYLPTPTATPPPCSHGCAHEHAHPLKSKKQAAPPYLPDRHNYRQTHPGLVKVEFGPEGQEFGSCLRAEKSFPAGTTICPIRNTLSGTKAYSSVQTLPDPPLDVGLFPSPAAAAAAGVPETYFSTAPPSTRRHIELNSDLLYVNHSCDPNVAFDVGGREAEEGEEDESGAWDGRWRVRALKDIAEGEILTFAYFSTEWDMDQPFECLCGTDKCLGTIRGAKDLDMDVLDRYFINDHIRAQKAFQAAAASIPRPPLTEEEKELYKRKCACCS